MKLRLIGGSDAVNNTEVDAAVRGNEIHILERIDDWIGGQYVIHRYTVDGDTACWVSTDFLGRRKRTVIQGRIIPDIVIYERSSDPSTRLMVRQLETEFAKNKPLRKPNEPKKVLQADIGSSNGSDSSNDPGAKG